MEVKDLNALQLGVLLQANFEAYWKQANVPVEISSTWCSDLAIAMFFEKRGEKRAVQDTIDDAFECWGRDFEMCSQLIMATNYLSWFCYENEYYKEFTGVFSRAYHSLLLQCEKTLSDDDIAKLARILD